MSWKEFLQAIGMVLAVGSILTTFTSVILFFREMSKTMREIRDLLPKLINKFEVCS